MGKILIFMDFKQKWKYLHLKYIDILKHCHNKNIIAFWGRRGINTAILIILQNEFILPNFNNTFGNYVKGNIEKYIFKAIFLQNFRKEKFFLMSFHSI